MIRQKHQGPGLRPTDLEHEACSRAPAFADSGVSSGKTEGAQVSDSLKARSFHAKELAAPDRAIQAVSCAIPGDAEIFAFDVVLRGAGGHVGLMMLHFDHGQSGRLGPVG